jgi:hypothetical protein
MSKFNGPRSVERASCASSSAMVMVNGGTYLVDLGAHHTLRFHTVQKDKTCSCGLARCNAVKAVEAYLKGGGQRAADTNSHLPPASCPICGAAIKVEGTGWRCTRDGTHYWLYRTQRLRAAREQYLNGLSVDERRDWDEILRAFDPNERAQFLAAHALTYPAGS